MVNSNRPSLLELEAEIVELEEQIENQAMRDRVLAVPQRLLTEARDHHRRGNAQEVALTINCACRLLERARDEFKK
jgi:hypothetical protein